MHFKYSSYLKIVIGCVQKILFGCTIIIMYDYTEYDYDNI